MNIENKMFEQRILDLYLSGLYVYDINEGRTVYINQRYSEITGYDLEDLKNLEKEEFSELIHPHDREAFKKHWDGFAAKKPDELSQLEFRFKKNDKSWIWCRSRDIVFDTKDCGAVTQIVGSLTDITEEKEKSRDLSITRKELLQLNKKINSERERLQFYFDSLPCIALLFDENGKIAKANDVAQELLGFTNKELKGMDFISHFIPERLVDYTRKMYSDIMTGDLKEQVNIENLVRCKDGTEKLIAWKNTHLFDSDGNYNGSISNGTDITKEARREQRLVILKEFAEIALKSKKLDQILYNAIKSVCTYTNWPFSHIYFPKSDCLEHSGIFFYSEGLNLQTLEKVISKFSFAYGEGTPGKAWQSQTGIWTHDFNQSKNTELTKKAQELGLCGAFTLPVLIKGRVVAILEFFYKKSSYERFDEFDIFIEELQQQLVTIIERDIAQKQLKAARQQAEKANQAKSIFLANMSHEIRTPMNAVLGHAQILQQDKKLSQEQRTSLEAIDKSGKHLLDLINDILNLSKIESGKMNVNYSIVQPEKVVQEVVDLFKLEFKKADLKLFIEGTSELPKFIKSDEIKIKQVLINLLGNALKFTPSGSILLNSSFSNGFIYFTVTDTGIGIPPENLKLVFNSFEQTEEGANLGGIGLGLSICKNLAQLLDGDVTVKSRPGRGSSFTFSIPYLAPKQKATCSEVNFANVSNVKVGQPAVKVLIVDDVLENREVLQSQLNSVGVQTKCVSNGEQAVSLFKEWNPGIILMGLAMPTMGGIEAIKTIKETRAGKRVIVFGVSTSSSAKEKELFLKSGADALIKKPVTFSSLLKEIQDFTNIEFEFYSPCDLNKIETSTKNSELALNTLSKKMNLSFKEAVIQGDIEKLSELSIKIKTTHNSLFKVVQEHLERFDLEGLEKLFRPSK